MLSRINVLFAALVAWNLVALIISIAFSTPCGTGLLNRQHHRVAFHAVNCTITGTEAPLGNPVGTWNEVETIPMKPGAAVDDGAGFAPPTDNVHRISHRRRWIQREETVQHRLLIRAKSSAEKRDGFAGSRGTAGGDQEPSVWNAIA